MGITESTLEGAIRASFASAFDERVFAYKRQQGFALDQPRIAVVIQQQIASECAGVGFSLNPLNNDFDEAVIDASWGQGESVVSGAVSPDHFVVDKVQWQIKEQRRGEKKTSIWLRDDGGVETREESRCDEFCLTGQQALEIVDLIKSVEQLYQKPVDIEWAYADGKLYLLQGRPITAYVPLDDSMLTEPDEERVLYYDVSLTEGLTINQAMSPLSMDYFLGVMEMINKQMMGPIPTDPYGDPTRRLFIVAGGRIYFNLSQMMTVMSPKLLAEEVAMADILLAKLLRNVDRTKYTAKNKVSVLRWSRLLPAIGRSLFYAWATLKSTVSAFLNPEKFYGRYANVVPPLIERLKLPLDDSLSLREAITSDNALLGPVIGQFSFPAVIAYVVNLARLNALSDGESREVQDLLEDAKTGVAGNEAADIGIQLYHMSKLVDPGDFQNLDALAVRFSKGEISPELRTLWDEFLNKYGHRGPGELELSNPRYYDDPRLALEQMSYMADSDFNPQTHLQSQIEKRSEAYRNLLKTLSWRKQWTLRGAYKSVDLLASTRDTFKYLLVLTDGAFRQRALAVGRRLVEREQLDVVDDIFYLKVDEADQADLGLEIDLRAIIAERRPFLERVAKVGAFPHLIDSRGRIGQIPVERGKPNELVGLGISRGVARGKVKVLNTPREKPLEKGDVLVAYTTDPGWTPLFVNASAIILEVGGMLQHGGVVAREYGKPSVAGIQGITKILKDGMEVEVDGTTGVIRVLDGSDIGGGSQHQAPMIEAKELSPEDIKLPLNIGSRAFSENKYSYYKWLRESSPVCKGKFAFMNVTFLSRYEDCLNLLKDDRFMRDRSHATGKGGKMPFPMPKSLRLASHSMILEDGAEHRRLRNLVHKAFTPRSIAKLGDRIEELTNDLLNSLEPQKTIDLVPSYSLAIPTTVIGEMLGVESADMKGFQSALNYLSKGFTGPALLKTLLWDFPKTVKFVKGLIEKKRLQPQDDILSHLIQAEEEGETLSEDELVSMVILLIIAGYETTVNLITNSVLTLLRHPEQLQRLRDDWELLDSAIEEVMRYHSPIEATKLHYPNQDITLHGVVIPKGSAVMPLLGAANHDPTVFDNPETFDIGRTPNRHLGFGMGIHYCLGAPLARLETKIALKNLFTRNPNLQLAVRPEKLKIVNVPSMNRYLSLPVEFS